jgi:hypothetical protein
MAPKAFDWPENASIGTIAFAGMARSYKSLTQSRGRGASTTL